MDIRLPRQSSIFGATSSRFKQAGGDGRSGSSAFADDDGEKRLDSFWPDRHDGSQTLAVAAMPSHVHGRSHLHIGPGRWSARDQISRFIVHMVSPRPVSTKACEAARRIVACDDRTAASCRPMIRSRICKRGGRHSESRDDAKSELQERTSRIIHCVSSFGIILGCSEPRPIQSIGRV